MTPEVSTAIDEIKTAFPTATVTIREDGDGGAFVFVEPLVLGPKYNQPDTWVGFHITFQYPYSDVYPHFVRGDLTRTDGQPLGDGTSNGAFEERPAIQLSRKSNRHNPATDTAVLKLIKVMEWLRTR
jgi:hypothetical protein